MSLQLEDYTGAVPVVISLSDTDCTVQEKPSPLTYMLPRTTVLMAVRAEVQTFFSAFTVAKADATPLVWLTCKGEPVPWQYPVGAIKDSVSAATIAGMNQMSARYIPPTEDAQPSPADLYPSVFATPLELEVRITCVAADKPPTVPCPGQEDAHLRRSGEQAIWDYMKQVLKGTFSLMYGSIKALMDARSEVINDMLAFATCTTMGDPFVRAFRAHRERVAGLRRMAGEPQNVAIMINVPFGRGQLQFMLFRVSTTDWALCKNISPAGEEGNVTRHNEDSTSDEKNNKNNSTASCSDGCEGPQSGDARQKKQPLDMPFGEVMWRALLVPYLQWHKHQGDDSATATNAAPFFDALSPFYAGLDDAPSLSHALASRAEMLVEDFIAAGDSTAERSMIRVALPTPPSLERRLCFMVQGLQPPLQTPVGYLLDRFASADMRLYVTLAAV
ncbi:hypothetical protein DQ04_00971040 [Trypanosoma grayi]|uniref:hypothetical protein n=1 Tax=Trypanosoma grayi TaxID=71804 RepID=UPI0004F49AF1|nr:hypothetical protein DQ04_00971040 [Trypanosoma grayi]KEG13494.1 hypothetical protein DQ04_00971040 [Trypanosoma grayi]